jgi:protein-tyrosine-phosphatase
MARAINRNTPLFEPVPQVPGSLDELRKTIICAITNEKEAVNGQYGGADVGRLLNALVRMVDKAFADHAAQNSKAIERAAEPVKTPEPWTVDRLKLIFDEHDTIFDLDDDVADLIVSIFNDENKKKGVAMEHSTHTAEFPEPWTGDELYEAFRQAVWGMGEKEDWQRFSDSVRDDFLILAMLVNQRMGSAPSPLKPWTAEQFYLQFGPPDYRLGTVTSVRLGTAQREACEKAAAVINKWAGLVS